MITHVSVIPSAVIVGDGIQLPSQTTQVQAEIVETLTDAHGQGTCGVPQEELH